MILIVSATFPPEQVVSAQLTKDLAEYLSENYKVRVLTPAPSRPFGFRFTSGPLLSDRYEHIVLDSFTYPKSQMGGRFIEGISFGKRVSEHIKKNSKSFKCCYINTWPMISQYIIVRTLKKYSIPSVMHVQDVYPESMLYRFPLKGLLIRKILMKIDRYILRNSTSIIAISRDMAEHFIRTRGIKAEKVTVVRNWRNEDDFRVSENSVVSGRLANLYEDTFVFMYMGNIGPVAGVDHLIHSFVKTGLEGSALVIAGCGPSKEKCMKLASGFKDHKIIFMDVPEGETGSVQQMADVMLLPVRKGAATSSVPSKLLAYMFSGKPVLACVDAGSDTAKAIEESGCGWVVPPADTDLLSMMMKKVACELPDLLNIRGMKGFDFAMENYSRRNNLPKLASVVTVTTR